jgi:hypothetical protein
MQRPQLVVVSEDAQRLESLAGDLMRRYEPDHQVVSSASVSDALVRLAGLGQAGADVALVITDERLAQMPAVGVLASAHERIREPSGSCSATGVTGLLRMPPLGRWLRDRSTIACWGRGLPGGVQAPDAGSVSSIISCSAGR